MEHPSDELADDLRDDVSDDQDCQRCEQRRQLREEHREAAFETIGDVQISYEHAFDPLALSGTLALNPQDNPGAAKVTAGPRNLRDAGLSFFDEPDYARNRLQRR